MNNKRGVGWFSFTSDDFDEEEIPIFFFFAFFFVVLLFSFFVNLQLLSNVLYHNIWWVEWRRIGERGEGLSSFLDSEGSVC